MKRKTLAASSAAVVAVAGIVLASQGNTFAAWTDTQSAEGATISAGTLQISTTPGSMVWKNQDGNVVDPATYKIVPGEELTGEQAVAVEMDGDNLAAKFLVSTPNSTTTIDGASTAYEVVRSDGEPLIERTATGTETEVALPNKAERDALGSTVVVDGKTITYQVKVHASFPASVHGTTGAGQSTDALKAVSVTVQHG